MLKIKKEKLPFDYNIKDMVEFICKYLNRDTRFINGNIITIDRTNLHYVEPHKLIIGKHLFLFFNHKNDVYYKTLAYKIEFKNLQRFIQNLD